MSIEVRLMQRHESSMANAFFNSIYKTARSQADFDWEFVNGPCGPAIYIIAIDNAVKDFLKVVGIQCAIPIKFTDAAGNTFLTAKSEDTLVDPFYRGQKIFERMYDLLFVECKNAGIKCIWGFTPAKKAFERIGFEIPFQAHQALMVFNPFTAFGYLSKLNAANKFVDRIKIAGLSMMSWMKPVGSGRIAKVKMEKVSITESKQITLAALKHQARYYYLDMTSAYLRWRLELNPFQNSYETFHFFIDDKFAADVIINRRSSLGYIEQIIFDDGLDAESKKQILLMIVDMMKKDTALVRMLCFDINNALAEQEELFKKCGFIVLNRGAHFVWKSFVEGEIDPRMLFLSRLFTQGNQ
ncbi:MAG: GNAT family N-acetyltransferase [Chryseolinea sp.]